MAEKAVAVGGEHRDLSQGLKRPPHRTTSSKSNSSGRSGKRSAFAGSRQPSSEDGKTLRFNNPEETRRGAFSIGGPSMWRAGMRKLSVAPELLNLQRAGLTRIRVRGHLNYKEIRQRFERQSTFHGICHASLAPNTRWRYFWYSAFLICLICLIIQIFFLVVKYRQFSKTVDLDLKFENAPFPSITLCNLNPYKKSAIMQNPETRRTLEAFSKLLGKGDKTEGAAALLQGSLAARVRRRKKRRLAKAKNRRYHQVFAKCLCDVDPISGERKGGCLAAQKGKVSIEFSSTLMNLHPSKCLCQFDTVSKSLWPCFPYSTWKEKLCSECVESLGHCPMRFYKGNERYEEIKDKVDICLCHKEYNHCVQNNENNVIPEISPDEEISTLNITAHTQRELSKLAGATTTTTTTEAPEVVEALGFSNLTDEIAIAAQAQQNMMFTVGEMEEKDKQSISTIKEDFIKRCSFNQKDCSLDNDFMLHYDQTYGNCYTFNFNRTQPLAAHRAGANYGLKVILYADINEYLPTTEAVGFRITVHDKWNMPFPDAFGYNAPTGFLSAFGVRMKQFIRLGYPYGNCKTHGEEAEDEEVIYKGFNYSVEACHRSCTQKEIVSRCGCADPMYPRPLKGGVVNCKATDPRARECIKDVSIEIGQQIADGTLESCICYQPCEETNYEVTYSAARWPSGSANVMECSSGDYLCLEKYRKNAAMVQVFYEELNYETMMESPSYTLTSALADLGGLTGLWIGASVVSLLEIVSLIIFTAQAYVRKRKETSSSNPPSLIVPLHKTSTKLSVLDLRQSLSSHSSNKTRSKQSLLVLDEMPSPIIEVTPKSSSSSLSRPPSKTSKSSTRYIPPGEELPCMCKYNEMGFIVVMKAMCPVHGYMVRRGYDYSLTNSEEDEDIDEDEQLEGTERTDHHNDVEALIEGDNAPTDAHDEE